MAHSDDSGQDQDVSRLRDGTAEDGGDIRARFNSIDLPSVPIIPAPPEVNYARPILGARKTGNSPNSVPTRVNVMPDSPSTDSSSETNGAAWGRGMAASLLLASSILVSLYIGQWLDGRFHTTPWLTLVMTLLGIAAGFVNLFRLLAATGPKSKK